MSSLMQQESIFDMAPKNMAEAKEFAETFSKSSFCPKYLQGKPGDTLIVMQMGFEYKLKLMQTFKTIGCINGIPFAYGDGKLALVKRSDHYESIKEWYDGSFEEGNLIAYCTAKRKNGEENTRSFSMAQAKRAGLLSKGGTWQQYPERMMQHRARGFALSDTFPDILFGLADEDEAREISSKREKDITPKQTIKTKGAEAVREVLGITQKKSEAITLDVLDEQGNVSISNDQRQAGIPAHSHLNIPPDLASPQQVEDLHDLIIKHGFSDVTINKWLKKANATCFEEMTKYEIQACIDHIISKVTTKIEG